MKHVIGLVITFNPPDNLFSNINALFDQLSHVIIVDNSSSAEIQSRLEQEISKRNSFLEVIFNPSNLGIATALNQGFAWAIEHGYEHVVVFDQDSTPAPDMIDNLMLAYNSYPDRDNIAIVAPNVQDLNAGIRALYLRPRGIFTFERTPCQGNTIDNISIVITSGSLNNLAVYKKIGPFREDFFIDYVDTEYCLRARQNGYEIIVACNAILNHRLGNQRTNRIGPFVLHPTFHAPFRWYYINRNRITMHRLYAFRFPYWMIYDLMSGCYALLKILFFEDEKIKKILAFMLGIWDGIFRRMGPISPKRKKLFEKRL